MSQEQQAPESPAEFQRRMLLEIELADGEFAKWRERGVKLIKRYRDEGDPARRGRSKFNILWSNIQTLKPAIYTRKPKPEVSRRHKDADPAGRLASQIVERALLYDVERYSDFDSALRAVVEDRVLPGRGTAWVRYEPHFKAGHQAVATTEDLDAAPRVDVVDYECAPVDYVYWQDFIHGPGRTWEEVPWVGRWVYLPKDALQKRFGDPQGDRGCPCEEYGYKVADIPLEHKPTGLTEEQSKSKEGAAQKCARIAEIWDRRTRKASWHVKGMPMPLDVVDDPLGLADFWPCPKPVYGTMSNDSLVPVPDYAMYQDQAEELDELTARIRLLTKAVKVVGVYDASQKGVQRLLNEGVDNTLVPVDSWAAFAERGGIKGVVDFLPLESVIQALDVLYKAREAVKQLIYETTGLSDIIRGASVATETATAQKIKSEYASLRIKDTQNDVARFAQDLLRMKAEIMCRHFDPQTLVRMAAIDINDQHLPAALELIKDDGLRDFRIEVSVDSMVQMDEQQEKADRIEFLTTVSQFMERAVPAGQQFPPLAPLLGELLLFTVRGFRAGRTLESQFEQGVQALANMPPPEPRPDPAIEKAKVDQDTALKKTELETRADIEKHKMSLDVEQAKHQISVASEQRLAEIPKEEIIAGIAPVMEQLAQGQAAVIQGIAAISQSNQQLMSALASIAQLVSSDRVTEIVRDPKTGAKMGRSRIVRAIQ